MKFLISFEDRKIMSYFKYLLEETFDCEVEMIDSKAFFTKNDLVGYNLFIFASNESLSLDQSKYLEKIKSSLAGIIVKSGEVFPDPQTIFKSMSQMLGIHYGTSEVSSGFIPVSMDYLTRIFQVQCDFFVKLSEVKFLKIIKKGEEIQQVELKRFSKNDLDRLYVRTEDFEDFLASIESSEKDYSNLTVEETKKEAVSDMTFAHDTFYRLSSNFGLNTKALAYANNAIESLYTFIETENNLQLAWKALMRRKNFITEHSLMVAYLSNAVLGHTEYKNESNSIRLSLAAILHDMELKNEKFYRLETENDDEFSQREVASYRAHVHASIELLSKFKSIPSDLDKILLTHHEKYDGSGFPRGLTGAKIPFLPTIFIVCHEFVTHMMKHEFSKEQIDLFIGQKKAEYTEGFFKEVILTLEKIR